MLEIHGRIRLLSFGAAALLRSLFSMLLVASASGALAAPGQLDSTFGTAGSVTPIDFGGNRAAGSFSGLVSLADSSVIVATDCVVGTPSGARSICLKRLTPDGQPDLLFGVAGLASATFPWNSSGDYFTVQDQTYLVLQPDGKLLAASACFSGVAVGACVARFLADGSLDATFNSGGALPGTQGLAYYLWGGAIALQANGKIIVAGGCSAAFCVTRLNANGTLDTTFASAASGTARVMPFSNPNDFPRITASASAVKVDSSDRIVVVGTCYVSNFNNTYPCVGRLTPNGSTDTTFVNPDTSARSYGSWFGVPTYGSSASGNDVAIQSDGKIVMIGDCGTSPATWTCVTRLVPGGAPDPGFTSANDTIVGTVKLSAPDGFKASRSLKIQTDGKLVFAGECSSIFSLFCVGRLNSGGTLDTTFDESPGNGNGIVQLAVGSGSGYASNLALSVTGKIVVFGSCRSSSPAPFGCAARLLGGNRDTSACTLNADANSAIEPSTDALLILRYLLGYRGNALTSGALGTNPTRTGQALETHLASLNLDADGDGQVHALTDGLLILRVMLGLSGDALTAGAVNTSSPTVRNAQQILTWIESTHGVACLP